MVTVAEVAGRSEKSGGIHSSSSSVSWKVTWLRQALRWMDPAAKVAFPRSSARASTRLSLRGGRVERLAWDSAEHRRTRARLPSRRR